MDMVFNVTMSSCSVTAAAVPTLDTAVYTVAKDAAG